MNVQEITLSYIQNARQRKPKVTLTSKNIDLELKLKNVLRGPQSFF
jgi:hypothetical protein